MQALLLLALVCGAFGGVVQRAEPTPIVLWHGMGDSCCNPDSMGWIMDLIKKQIPGVYIYSVALAEGDFEDREKSFLANMNDEVAKICAKIAADPKLANGYHAMGFSQGGQFLRAIAQRCPAPQMKNLVTLGGQHQGVYGREKEGEGREGDETGLPRCGDDNAICDGIRQLLDMGVYIDFIQNSIVQAQYFHDSDDEATYRDKSIFIGEINNEKTQNAAYKDNLSKLTNLVLVMFSEDQMVIPRESSWFGFYAEKDIDTVVPYNQTKLYTEDRIGLKALDQSGRLHFLSMKGDHLQIDKTMFVNDIINVYLKQ